MTDTIELRQEAGVATLVLNNPQRHNSLGQEQLTKIAACLDTVAADASNRVLIVTGARGKTFCAGASLGELGSGALRDNRFQRMTAQLAAMEVPTVCAMNGNVFGGGAELAVSCDFRIGIQEMRMRVPAAALGLCYPPDGIQRFINALGVQVARRVLVAAEEFQAQTLLDVGFLDHLVAADELDVKAQALASQIAGLAPLSVKAMKAILGRYSHDAMDLEHATALVEECLASADLQEGLAAQRGKRKPVFNGN